MDISKYNKADVLRLLYNRAKVQGMGFLQARPGDMTKEEATDLIHQRSSLHQRSRLYFDYLFGRVMKVDLSNNELDTRLYNRDNGPGAAEKAIEGLDIGLDISCSICKYEDDGICSNWAEPQLKNGKCALYEPAIGGNIAQHKPKRMIQI